VGRGCLFFIEGVVGARYGTFAKQFIANRKWTSLAIALLLGLILFLIYRAPRLRRQQYSQTD